MQKKSVDLATVLVYLGVKLKGLTVIMTIHIFGFKIKVIFVRYINRFKGFCINSPLSILSCYSTQITPDFNTFLTNVLFPSTRKYNIVHKESVPICNTLTGLQISYFKDPLYTAPLPEEPRFIHYNNICDIFALKYNLAINFCVGLLSCECQLGPGLLCQHNFENNRSLKASSIMPA